MATTTVDAKTQNAISAANTRLKARKLGLTIVANGNKLYLRGRAWDPENPTVRKRRWFTLGVGAHLAGVKAAEDMAQEAAVAIARRELPVFVEKAPPEKSIAEYLVGFERQFRKEKGEAFNEDTWKGEYLGPLSMLPPAASPTVEVFLQTIEKESEAKTRKRVRYCAAMRKFGTYCGLDVQTGNLNKGYDSSAKPRDLPDAETVFRVYEIIRGSGQKDAKAWSDCWMLMFVFGLRPHELWHLDLETFRHGGHVLRVTGGKTGGRNVYGMFKEWIDRFELHAAEIPVWKGKDRNEDRSHWVHQRLTRKQDFNVRELMPEYPKFVPYDLRHAYAVRCMLANVQDRIAAEWMGHSVEVHRRTYQRWVPSQDVEAIYERANAAL